MNEILLGLHHLTAVSARIRENRRFFTEVLGMRLVKRSVNQDDTSAYHLFYADAVGTPGTDITFFDWPAPPERRGNRSITRTGLRVGSEDSLPWWRERLAEEGISTSAPFERAGTPAIEFEDPEGQRLAIVVDGGRGDEPTPWDRSPVPAEHQFRGFGPVEITVPELGPTAEVLTGIMGMRPVGIWEREAPAAGPAGPVHRFAMGEGTEGSPGLHAELHVAIDCTSPPHRLGAGGVHHVAFRVADDAYGAWAERLNRMGMPNSGKVDRYYFRSLYFREPGGILFELATDGPGFAVDEDPETLGESLALPPFLEGRRARIEAGLKPID